MKNKLTNLLDLLKLFLDNLKSRGSSAATIRNYRSDIKQLITFAKSNQSPTVEAEQLFNPVTLKSFVKSQHQKGLKKSSITRKLASISQFQIWVNNYSKSISHPKSYIQSPTSNSKQPITKHPKLTLTEWLRRRSFLPYINLALIILFLSGMSVLTYRQLVTQAPGSLAYPTTLTRPSRVLSFQGRLTDNSKNAITSSSAMTFKLYNSASGGTQLWDSGSCSVTPDEDGIFNVTLGSQCGAEIGESVFSENSSVWMEANVGGETLSPRQPLATVPYALNTETVQGYPAFETAVANSVLTMNSAGDIVLGSTSPTVTSTTGTLTIEGQTLILQTVSGSGGDITISPDGTGDIYFQGSTYNLSDTGDLTLGGRLTFENAEYIHNETDGSLVLGESGGKTITLDLDASNPSIDSSTGVLNTGGDLTIAGGELFITPTTSSSSTTEGTIYYDSDNDNLYVYADGSFVDLTSSGSPGGSDTQFQYNNGGGFGGTSTFIYNDSTLALSITDDLDFIFGTDENIVIDAEATDSTGTAGVINLDLDATSSQQAINLDIETITDSVWSRLDS